MVIVSTYSSWTRNRIGPDLRDLIRNAGEGEVRYHAAVGKPRGWVGCEVRSPEGRGVATGHDPHAAFTAALANVRPIVSLLSGDAA